MTKIKWHRYILSYVKNVFPETFSVLLNLDQLRCKLLCHYSKTLRFTLILITKDNWIVLNLIKGAEKHFDAETFDKNVSIKYLYFGRTFLKTILKKRKLFFEFKWTFFKTMNTVWQNNSVSILLVWVYSLPVFIPSILHYRSIRTDFKTFSLLRNKQYKILSSMKSFFAIWSDYEWSLAIENL